MNLIGNGKNGETLYIVHLGTGIAWTPKFYVFAYNETEAADLVADYCEKNGFDGLYADHYELADECEIGQTVEEYAEAHNLTCCGNHGIYIEIVRMEAVS